MIESQEKQQPCAHCGEVLYRPHMLDERGWCPVCVKGEFMPWAPPAVAEFAYFCFTHRLSPATAADWQVAMAGYVMTLESGDE